MLTATTIDGLKALRLDAMAAALAEQRDQPGYAGLGFEERLGLLVDRELTERSNRRMERCLKTARLRAAATIEDIDFHHPRGLDRGQVLALAEAHWVASHQAVLVTGPTGAGKTTTLNYLIDLINTERRCKIVTVEDPIEYVHRNKNAIVVQQEVLTDTHSFNRALIHILRQDPDVIVVGEMRDHETISAALTAAETGHLVLATMHSPNVSHAFERIVGVFEGSAQRQIIMQLATCLQGIIAQDLLPAVDRNSRVLAYELLVANGAVRNLIRENNKHMLETIIQTGGKDGMMLMDACIYDLYCRALITYDTALSRARNPERMAKKH